MMDLSSLIVLSVALVCLTSAAEIFIPAQAPAVWSVGRTRLNTDSVSLSFNWENTQFYINVENASYVKACILFLFLCLRQDESPGERCDRSLYYLRRLF